MKHSLRRCIFVRDSLQHQPAIRQTIWLLCRWWCFFQDMQGPPLSSRTAVRQNDASFSDDRPEEACASWCCVNTQRRTAFSVVCVLLPQTTNRPAPVKLQDPLRFFAVSATHRKIRSLLFEGPLCTFTSVFRSNAHPHGESPTSFLPVPELMTVKTPERCNIYPPQHEHFITE